MESLDKDVIDRLGRDMGGSGGISRIISMYLGKLAGEVATLHELEEAGDLAGLGDAAHRLKSSTAMLGASRLAEILAGLEAAAKSGHGTGASQRLAEFDGEVVGVSAEMRKLVEA